MGTILLTTIALLAALITLWLLYRLAVRYGHCLIALALGYGAGFVVVMGVMRVMI